MLNLLVFTPLFLRPQTLSLLKIFFFLWPKSPPPPPLSSMFFLGEFFPNFRVKALFWHETLRKVFGGDWPGDFFLNEIFMFLGGQNPFNLFILLGKNLVMFFELFCLHPPKKLESSRPPKPLKFFCAQHQIKKNWGFGFTPLLAKLKNISGFLFFFVSPPLFPLNFLEKKTTWFF